MKANELRIGNYLNGKQGHVIISEIRTNNSVKILDNTSSFYVGTCLKPIELSESILKQFWFKLVFAGQGDGFIYQYGKLCNTITIHSRNRNIFLYSTFNSCEIKIQYVHQLQNLYFALTGKELTL